MQYVCHNHRILRIVRALAIALVLGISVASCSRAEPAQDIAHFEPAAARPSPFAQQKVLLDASSFVSNDATAAGDAKSVPGLKIVVVLDNACAAKRCAAETGTKSLACHLFSSADRRADMPVQMYTHQLTSERTPAEIEGWVKNDACVIGVSNHNSFQAQATFDDSYYNTQKTYFDTMERPAFTDKIPSSELEMVTVAVIDSGVGSHPDLGGSDAVPGVWKRLDMRSNSSRLNPECSSLPAYTNEVPQHPHGTFVAGIIAGTPNNQLGIAGVAPNVQILSIAITDCKGRMGSADIGNAILQAVADEAEVINLSLGGGSDDAALRFAFITALNKHVVMVVAAGNELKDLVAKPAYPANYGQNFPGVLTVGWATQAGAIERGNGADSGSNFSPSVVRIAAPGTGILSMMVPASFSGFVPTVPGYGMASGSSAATPMVSGAAALAIGYMKHRGMAYDEALIDYLVSTKGVNSRPELLPYVKDGALLSFDKLATILLYLANTGISPMPMQVSTPSLTFSGNPPTPALTFSTSWNLNATHYGARLGVFDTSPGCGFSAPCLIQDFPLGGNSGSRNIGLSRNQLLPMLPLVSAANPNMDINVTVAIYYKNYNSAGIANKNFGIDAKTSINLRDFDGSTTSSPFLGKVTNMRTDSVNFYVQGWTCVQRSNKALTVEILGPNGSSITSDFGYSYDYMVAHSGVLDGMGLMRGPFVVNEGKTQLQGATAYKSGLEASALVIKDCQTLTTAQGFEFAVPLSYIKAQGLGGKSFTVRATHAKQSSTKLQLKDPSGNDTFTFPEVNYQASIPSTLNVNRTSDAVALTGNLCSESPSPIRMEVSYSSWDYLCRAFNKTGFPNSDCRPPSPTYFPPTLHDPAVTSTDQHSVHYLHQTPILTEIYNLGLTAAEMSNFQAYFPVFPPNSSYRGPTVEFRATGRVPSQAVIDQFVAKGLKEAVTGVPLTGVRLERNRLSSIGSTATSLTAAYLADRSSVSVNAPTVNPYPFLAEYWDWHDVGEDYTPSVVAYPIDTNRPVGSYLTNTYNGIKKLMREVKKYETPIGAESFVLGNQVIGSGTKEGSSCQFRFQFNQRFDGIASFSPDFETYEFQMLKAGLSTTSLTPDSAASTMQELPLDVRFYQDGVMIQHLVVGYGTSSTKIPTLGRGN